MGLHHWIVSYSCLTVVYSTCILDPGLPEKKYIHLGDINLGSILPISNSDKVKACGEGVRATSIVQIIEAMVFAIDTINGRDDILPNITLGFVILDGCTKGSTVVSQGVSFLPRLYDSGTCAAAKNTKVIPSYDVIGVIAAMASSSSMAVGRLFGTLKVPQISFASTSDELSNKELYPYFLRVMPPDKFQVETMMNLILYYGWSYISVIYTEGSYGEMAFKNIKAFTERHSICIAVEKKIAQFASPEEHGNVVKKLLDNKNAKVVILFTVSTNAIELMKAVEREKAQKRFLWIGSEAWGLRIQNFGESWKTALGAFTMKVYTKEASDFAAHFKSLTPQNSSNPWFNSFWEEQFSCTINTYNDSCSNNQLSESDKFQTLSVVSSVIDAVNAFAIGAQHAINTACVGLSPQNLSQCLDGETLLHSIRNITFSGNIGQIQFDSNGDVLATYMVDQLQQSGETYSQVHVATWNAASGNMSVIDDRISWQYINLFDSESVPESVCSKPCDPGEFLIQKELPCCWECRRCRETEHVVQNGTECFECPDNFWPDSNTNYTTCYLIPHTTIELHDPIPVILFVLALIGICSAVAILVFYIKHRDTRHIKAASRELSFMMLSGIIVGYLSTVVSLFSHVTSGLCIVNYIGFCLGFSWIYAPLLVRTNRIYRIFEMGKKTKQRPSLISPVSQIVIASIVISVQIALCTVTTLVKTPAIRYSMPVRTEKYVEKYCDVTLEGLLNFLIYNMGLILICSFFAFKTRKLPDNFNESRFISMCVYTTLVIWLAFIPSYFTTGREYYKTILLSTALVLNGTVVLLFLYLPKVYAVLYVKDLEDRNVGVTTITATRHATINATVTNFGQIGPISSNIE